MTLVSEYDTQIYISSQSTTHIFTCRSRSTTQIHVSVSAYDTDSHVGLRVRHNFTCQSCHTHIYMSVSEYHRQINMSAYRQSTTYRFTCWRTDRVRHTDLHVGVPTEYNIQIYMLEYRHSTTHRFNSSVWLYNSYIYIAASSTHETHNYLQGATTVTYTAHVDPRERHSHVYRSSPEYYTQIRVFYMSASEYDA